MTLLLCFLTLVRLRKRLKNPLLPPTTAAIIVFKVCNLEGACRVISCSTAGAITNCGEVLLDFYNQSKKLSDLDAGNWQESDVDVSLCKAGLW